MGAKGLKDSGDLDLESNLYGATTKCWTHISPQGIKRFESGNTLSDLSIQTLNYIHSVNNSQVQQGTCKSTQNVCFNQELLSEASELLNQIKNAISELELPSETTQEIEAETRAIKCQLESSAPKASRIKSGFEFVRDVLKDIVTNVIALPIIGNINMFLSKFFH